MNKPRTETNIGRLVTKAYRKGLRSRRVRPSKIGKTADGGTADRNFWLSLIDSLPMQGLQGSSGHRALLLTLICVAVVFVRLGGAHLHLCFDGGEPPVSLQFTDVEHHAEHHVGDVHDDFDLSLAGDMIAKSKASSFDLPLLLLAALLLPLLPTAGVSVPARRPPRRPIPRPPFLRPPLRGPPSASSC